jgi:protein-S-isoprenylcysteine O-methyltransferase Ste14
MGGRLGGAWERTPLPAPTLVGIAAAVAAHHLRPLHLPGWTRQTGWAVILGGFALVAAAGRERGPGSLDEPESLVTQGVHGYSRNPMYLGFSILHVGVAGATGNAWILASAPVSAALLHHAVLREERFLQKRFGAAYDAYRSEVPRYW